MQITRAQVECPKQLIVTKAVEGTPPLGTLFTIHVRCSHPIATDAYAEASQTTVDEDLFFEFVGTEGARGVFGTIPMFNVQPNDSCNVTEPDTGGATSVDYSCFGTSPACQPNSKSQDFQYGAPAVDETVTVLVRNSFAVTPVGSPVTPVGSPVTPVIIQPAFTG